MEIISGFIFIIFLVVSFGCGIAGIFNHGKTFWFSNKFSSLKKKKFALPLHFIVYPYVVMVISAIIIGIGSTSDEVTAANTEQNTQTEQSISGLKASNNNKFIDVPSGFTPVHSVAESKKIVLNYLQSSNVPSGSPIVEVEDRGNGKVYQHDGSLYYVFTLRDPKLNECTFAIDVNGGEIFYYEDSKLQGLDQWNRYLDGIRKHDEEVAKAEFEKWHGLKVIRSEYTIESYGLGLEAIRINATIKNTTDENHNYTLVFETYDKKGNVVNVVKDNRDIKAHQEYPLVARIPAGNTIVRAAIVGAY